MAQQKVTEVGELLGEDEQRDAIHIAVAPMIAAEKLNPGQHVGLIDRGQHAGVTKTPIGIVDPYLKEQVLPGQRFWVFLYPYTVTTLRHQWSHPAFEDKSLPEKVPMRFSESEEWLFDYANQSDLGYDELMDAAHNYLNSGDYLSDGSRWEGHYVPKEFWEHFEKVSGRKVDESNRGSFFSCSC